MPAPRQRFQCEETMARSHQRGTVRLEHKSWVGYLNLKVLDPTSGESKWKKQRVGVLGAKSETTKYHAYDKLERIIAQKTGGTTEPRADESVVTLGWFTRNRFFPLREGSTWKEATAETHKSAIEQDILRPLGGLPLKQVDKVTLQTHLNDLAKLLSEGRVKHARFYLKAIFEEAIDQEFVAKNPARKLALPKQLRPVDRTTLTWDQLRSVLASVSLRDRFAKARYDRNLSPKRVICAAVGWFQYGPRYAQSHTHGVSGKLRDFGKTQKALRTVHLPEGLVNELWLWKQECPDHSPEAFIFPNARKRNGANKNGFIRTDNYRTRVVTKLATELGLPKLNFQVLRRSIATLAQTKGGVKDVQGVLGHSKADTTVNVYMQPIEAGVKQTLDAIYSELTTPKMRAGL